MEYFGGMAARAPSNAAHGRPPRPPRVTLREVAARSRVSRAVASRALSGRSGVAQETRKRVRSVARELGYRASVLARALSAGRNAPLRCAVVGLGLRAEGLGGVFYGRVLAGLAAQAATESMDIHLIAIPGEAAERREALRRLVAEDRADGLILLTFLPLTLADVAPLDRAGVPYVLVNRHLGNHPINCVTFAWEEATEDALLRLVRAGHRHLALLLPGEENTTVAGHATGWRTGVRRLGLSEQDAPVLRYPGSPGDTNDALTHGGALARRLLCDGLPSTGQLPTAMVGFNDWCALAALRAAAERGVRVPEELSVIGFDDTLIGVGTTPPLCSYGPRFVEQGRQAAGLLASAVRDRLAAPRRVVVPIDFVCRGSCGPAPVGARLDSATLIRARR